MLLMLPNGRAVRSFGPGLRGRGFATGEPAVAKAEEGLFHDEMEEPAAEQGDGDADPESGVAVVADAAGTEEFVGEVDELFVGQVDRIG